MAQQTAITKTAVEWFAEKVEKILIDLKKNNNAFQLELCLHGLNELEEQAKQMEKEQIEQAFGAGNSTVYDWDDSSKKRYYNETYIDVTRSPTK